MKARLLLLVAALALAVPTFASVISVDFGGATGGTIDALKTGGEVGSSIAITEVDIYVDGTLALPLTGVTGTCGASSNEGCLNFNTVTGAITITGDSVTLLDGAITSSSFGPLGSVESFSASGTDTMPFLSLLVPGLGSQPATFGGFSITVGKGSTSDGHGGKLFNVASTDFQSTVTPEPASMMLLGTFLSLAGGFLSRRKRA